MANLGSGKVVIWDTAGLAASGSILIEKKSRRSELALYVMPRAVDAFVLALTKKRWVPSVKFGEVILFSLCMGGLMYYRSAATHCTSSFCFGYCWVLSATLIILCSVCMCNLIVCQVINPTHPTSELC